jgi:LysM repeat protein
MGMGMAYTAVAEGPEALFFNPAGLAASDYTQVQTGLGRMLSPTGLVSFGTMAYTRPLPILPGSTVGAAFYGLRQNDSGDKDSFLLHFSHQMRFPQIYLHQPVKFGGNFKFMNISKDNGASKFGLGLDAGLIVDSGKDFKAGLSLMDMSTSLGVDNPSLNLGAAYRLYRRSTLAMDIRIRPGLTQVFPGVEMDFFQQLLQVRLGKGFPLDGEGQWAFGIGANFSPVLIDFAVQVPWAGFNRPGGAFQLGATYKFGAPPFFGRYIGSAARRAEDLRSDILDLEGRKKDLESQAGAAETDRTSVEGQVRTLQERLKELQDRTREAERKLEVTEYDLSHAVPKPPKVEEAPKLKPEPKPRAPSAPAFPRRHVVKPGETLRAIAREHYGDATLWERIFEANSDKIERGLPVEGAVLTIPAPR